MTSPSASLITCSYAPDFERCRRLCATVDRYVDQRIEHLIIVPGRDRKLFAPLANDRTRIVSVQSLMPFGTVQLPAQRRWWLCPGCLPIRGWIMQQVTKIAAAELVETDALVFVDSDVSFVQPFGPDNITRDGRVRLHRVPGAADIPAHHRWHRRAGELLGIEPRDYFGSDFIAQLVCWRRDAVLAMCQRIEQTHRRPWRKVLFNTLHFSEYVVYGVYAEFVADDWAGHTPDDRDLCHSSWHHSPDHQLDLDAFFAKFEPRQVAVLVQSNLGIDPDRYADHLARLEQRLNNMDTPAADTPAPAMTSRA